MAYSALPTAVTGDLWTAANHNTYIKDNFAAGLPDLFTTAGQIAYASAANVGALLDIGTAGQVLRVNDGATAPEWAADFSGVRITTSDQNCSTGSVTVVFNNEEYDTHNYWSTDNPDAVIAPWSGIYQFTGHATFDELTTDTSSSPIFLVYLFSSSSNNNLISKQYGYPGTATTVNWSHIRYCSSGTDMLINIYCTKFAEQTTDFSAEVDYQVTWLGTT